MRLSFDTYLAVAGIVFGLVAIVMAIPPLFQMMFGRPRLEFNADEFTGPDGKLLLIAIKNAPTKSRFLRKIGVEREVGNVHAFIDIQEQGTNKFLRKDIFGLLNCAPTREQGLVMARAFVGFNVGISIIGQRVDAEIIDARAEASAPIAPGDYTAYVRIICGEQVHKMKRNFKIGKEQHETFWV